MAARTKQGFSLPFPVWMKRELKPFLDETFSDLSVGRTGLFSPPEVQGLWRSFLANDDSRQWSRVWSLAVLLAFTSRRIVSAQPKVGQVSDLTHLNLDRCSAPKGQNPMAQDSALGLKENRTASAERAKSPLSKPNQVKDLTYSNSAASARKQRSLVPGLWSVVPAKRHRTLMLAPEIFASEGGIPRILQTYLRALCELAEPDEAVRLLALNDSVVGSSDVRRCTNGRLEDWFVCSRDKPRFVRAALRMSRNCDRIVCGHLFQLPVAWLARCLNPRLKYYLVAHGIEIWRPFGFAERLAVRGAAKIFCVSDYTRRELLKNCPLPEGRAVVLHNALDPLFEINGGVPLAQCPPTILVVTRLSSADRYKGVQHMIEAMPVVRTAIPGATLRVVGRGDDLPRLQSLRHQLGLGNAVEFLGYVDDKRLAQELRTCRLFALPSKKEGFGLVFLEAMAHGRPCLGARAGGIPEVITEETGVLADYGDVPGIAAASIAALRRDWNEDAILARARQFAYSQFRDRLASLLAA
jgi:glycosyltransferase involved in cell wall biosynthesis